MLNNVNLQNPNKTDLILEALNTMSGNIVTFDGVGGMPLKKLTVNIEPVQEGTGDPSPDNVRPITGWTGAQVERTGKNLLGGLDLAEAFRGANGFSLDTDNKSFTFNRTKYPIAGHLKFKPNTQYSLIRTYKGQRNTCLTWIYSDGTKESIVFSAYEDKFTSVSTSSPGKTIDHIELQWAVTGVVTVYYEETGLFEGIVTADDFEPYQGEIHDITFPSEAGTVYGGTIDVIKGILTVTHGNIAEYAGEELPGAWISSMDVYTGGAVPTTGAQVVYELAEPVIYQLNPEKVTALLGENNIWADSGDVGVQYGQYLSTLKEYIDAKVADLQAQIDSNEEVAP